MRRDFDHSHKDVEILTGASADISALPGAGSFGELRSELLRFGLQSLARLTELMDRNEFRSSSRFSEAVSIDQLEMVEAELRNQGLLRRGPLQVSSLFHLVQHETNILKWRARRAGIWNDRCRFMVNIPAYVAWQGRQIFSHFCSESTPNGTPTTLVQAQLGPSSEGKSRALSNLEYLNDFASYLLGEHGEGKNRYERGLDLVLRVLAERDKKENESADSTAVLDILLPISSRDFLANLRKTQQHSERC